MNTELEKVLTVKNWEIKQLIKQPTRVTTEGCTLTDIILSNNKSAVSSTNIFPLSLSNHDTIVLAK